MDHVKVQITLEQGIEVPAYATQGASGIDLRTKIHVTLEPMERKLVPTGVCIAIPVGFEAQVRPRSGLALKHGISMVNTPGTIDSDYRGEVQVLLINLGLNVVKLAKGDRIAQLVVGPVAKATLEVVPSLDTTERAEGGFGSTGTE